MPNFFQLKNDISGARFIFYIDFQKFICSFFFAKPRSFAAGGPSAAEWVAEGQTEFFERSEKNEGPSRPASPAA
ncbi:hypothetical protein [Saprospira grandis]|uniref:hypothetical protein n=1 Tax=Saprospira grandis TaxID=1008 RepID=UPI0012DE46A8|nr:hypothetical protein [Saprospira grandis]